MIVLPFPPASLSGHAKGHWRSKSSPTATHRERARIAAIEVAPSVPASGDIRVHVRFVPPDRRGDRVNFPNRMKPYFDGIAEALGVNDARFVPSFEYAEPEKPGRVEVNLAGLASAQVFDLRAFAKRIVEAGIVGAKGEPSEMKARIMIAYEHGHLTAEEAEVWIVLQGLEAA